VRISPSTLLGIKASDGILMPLMPRKMGIRHQNPTVAYLVSHTKSPREAISWLSSSPLNARRKVRLRDFFLSEAHRQAPRIAFLDPSRLGHTLQRLTHDRRREA
jgi:hypothetical protein